MNSSTKGSWDNSQVGNRARRRDTAGKGGEAAIGGGAAGELGVPPREGKQVSQGHTACPQTKILATPSLPGAVSLLPCCKFHHCSPLLPQSQQGTQETEPPCPEIIKELCRLRVQHLGERLPGGRGFGLPSSTPKKLLRISRRQHQVCNLARTERGTPSKKTTPLSSEKGLRHSLPSPSRMEPQFPHL